jgi:ATP-binding cassette subfamily B protein
MAQRKYRDIEIYQRVFAEARPFWPQLSAILFLSLLSAPLALLYPLPMKIAVDCVLGKQPLPAWGRALLPGIQHSNNAGIVLVVALSLLIALLVHLLGLASWLLQTYTGEKLVLNFRARLFRHMQRLSLAYHDSKGPTDTTYRVQHDAPAINYIAIHGVVPFVTAVFTFAGMLYVSWHIDWQLALIALCATPLLFVLTQASSNRARDRWSRLIDLDSSTMSVVHEVLSAMRVVKAFGQEEREQQRFLHRSKERMWGQVQLALVQGSFYVFIGLTLAAGMAGALLLGILHVRSGALTLGNLLIIVAYLGQMYEPLRTISNKFSEQQSSLASARRAFALLDARPEAPERPGALPLRRAKGAIEFRDVSFVYERNTVLRKVSFEVAAGTRVGIAGTSGAGKSTLTSLLTRFYDPSEGQILLDGVDLRDYRLADLRQQFGVVLQDPVLFSTTIGENIAYARPDAGMQEIMAAARAASAHEFIMKLPEGYETQVGERGVCLSGGERQRVSVARALLKDCPILVLDEPTSSVDIGTEAEIMDALDTVARDRTTFLITHRLTSLRDCDLIVVLENGRIKDVIRNVESAIGDGTLMMHLHQVNGLALAATPAD